MRSGRRAQGRASALSQGLGTQGKAEARRRLGSVLQNEDFRLRVDAHLREQSRTEEGTPGQDV